MAPTDSEVHKRTFSHVGICSFRGLNKQLGCSPQPQSGSRVNDDDVQLPYLMLPIKKVVTLRERGGGLKSDRNLSNFTRNSFVLRLTSNVSTVKKLPPRNRGTIIINYKAGKEHVPFPDFLSGHPRLCFIII